MLEEQKIKTVACTRGEHALTPHSGRSGVGGSSGSRGKGYMCRARNIGYIVLLLAGVGGLPPQSPLKGSSTLERTHYIHLRRVRQRDKREAQRKENTAARGKRGEKNEVEAPATREKSVTRKIGFRHFS